MTKIVHSLLAVAASSSILLAQGWTGGPGKGLKFDGGDTFSLGLSNQLQTHYVYSAGDNPVMSSFRVRRARTSLKGTAFNKDISYVLTVDAMDDGAGGAAANGSLKDGHVTWKFLNHEDYSIGLRVGQGKTQFGLEGTGSSKGLFFVERAISARTFSDARSTGAWVQGAGMQNKLRWNAGAMNGSATSFTSIGEQAANDDNELCYVASANFDPMGDITGGKGNEGWMQGDFRTDDRSLAGTVGLGLAVENGKVGAADAENTTFNVNTAWNLEGFQILAEYFSTTSDVTGAAADVDADGFAVSGSWVMPKNGDSAIQWAFGLRIAQQDLTDPGIPGGDETTDVSIVANAFYHGHDCKTQVELTQRNMDVADTDDTILSIAFQLLF